VRPLRRADDLVFPGLKLGSALSDMTLAAVLRRMGIPLSKASPHGFRSTFKDWATETTSFPNELPEAALAHISGDATERANRRGDQLARRRELMETWARYCEPGGDENVIVFG
jgi:integrase